MSASLVGSEMCIRDSPVPVLEGEGGRRCGDGCAAEGSGRTRGSGGASACLLYTSDAADDM
eukprot:14398463-Alexandrium_andersonii.AAC.1